MKKQMSKLLCSYFSSIWCCDSSWRLTSLPLGWHGQPLEKTPGNDRGGWAWLQSRSRKPNKAFSFHTRFSTSPSPLVQTPLFPTKEPCLAEQSVT